MQGVNSRADMWLMSRMSYFKPEHMPYISEKVRQLDEHQMNVLMTVNFTDPTTILLLSICVPFIGINGVDRLVLGDIAIGVGKLLTLGGCGIWWIIDIFFVMDRARELNYQTLLRTLGYTGYTENTGHTGYMQ